MHRPEYRRNDRNAVQTFCDENDTSASGKEDFKVRYNSESINVAKHKVLVDCRARAHIVNDRS